MRQSASGNKDRALDDMILAIDRQIHIAQEMFLNEVLLLLRMTKLSLQTQRYAIGNNELNAFCSALQDRAAQQQQHFERQPPVKMPASPRRRRRIRVLSEKLMKQGR